MKNNPILLFFRNLNNKTWIRNIQGYLQMNLKQLSKNIKQYKKVKLIYH